MNKLHIEDQVFELPSSMDEMSNDQLIELAGLLAQEIAIQEIKVKMLFVCMKARMLRMKKGNYRIRVHSKTIVLSVDEVTLASSAFDYLFQKPDKKGNCLPNITLTRCPYPTVVVDGRTFFAPDDYLEDMIYNQYIYLQSFDQAIMTQPEVMYQWLGTMFLEDKETFNQKELNVELMKQLPPHIYILMNWFWIGSCNFIADKFPRVFPDGNDPSSEDVYSSQQKLLDYIAKGDPAKKKEYKADKLYDILFSLDFLLEKEEEQAQPVVG